MKCYVDSSVVLRHLMMNDTAFARNAEYDKVGCSELLPIEYSHVIGRHRLEELIDDEQITSPRQDLRDMTSGMYVMAMTEGVKHRALGSFPTVVGTLDALSGSMGQRSYQG